MYFRYKCVEVLRLLDDGERHAKEEKEEGTKKAKEERQEEEEDERPYTRQDC